MENNKDPEQLRKDIFNNYVQNQTERLMDQNNIYTSRTDHYTLKAALTQGVVVITKEYKAGNAEGVIITLQELETILLRTKPKTPRKKIL